MMDIYLFRMSDYKYDDEIFEIIFSCFKDDEDYFYFKNFIKSYFENFIEKNIQKYNPPIFNFIAQMDSNDFFPELYYNNPDSFSQSFFFRVYRKKIVSKYLESYEVFSFLKKNKISNDILFSHVNEKQIIYSYGFYSLKNSPIHESKLENVIYILLSHNCDIFSDFMYNGKTERICLVDDTNFFSKIFNDGILDLISDLENFLFQENFAVYSKNVLIYLPFFRLSFNDENKQRILNTLSSYSFSIAQNKNIFKDFDSFPDIFELIEKEIKNIINEKKFKNNNSEQNLLITKKLLDLYGLKYENIEELNSFNFNFLIQNLIEIDFPIQLVDKLLKLIENNENNNLETHLDYIIKITLLFCTNIVGSSYIYNSNFIPKILKILIKIDFNKYLDFNLEMIFILKIVFNRIIIDISFLYIAKSEKITLREYLFYILFRNEPIISNESFYYFNNFNNLLNKIKSTYNFIFKKENNIFLKSFENINSDESYLNIIKTIVLNMKKGFNGMNWEEEDVFDDLYKDLSSNIYIKKEDLIFEKKIEEQIEKEKEKIIIQSKIPGLIILDILHCFENLNQTNFYLKFEEETFYDDKNNDLISIFINENLPFAVKSLILNFLLKFVLTLKIDEENNKIFGPLLCENERIKIFEKDEISNYNMVKLYYEVVSEQEINYDEIKFELNASEKHLNETIKLMNILILCIELLKKKQNFLDFEKAFIEKNGLYDFCVSIIQAINYLSNLIINTNNIHEMYLLLINFLKMKIFL